MRSFVLMLALAVNPTPAWLVGQRALDLRMENLEDRLRKVEKITSGGAIREYTIDSAAGVIKCRVGCEFVEEK